MRTSLPLAGIGLAAVIALTGCSTGSPAARTDSSAAEMSEETHTDTVNSDGSGLRAALTALLDLLREAASHMPMTAQALASGIAENQDIH